MLVPRKPAPRKHGLVLRKRGAIAARPRRDGAASAETPRRARHCVARGFMVFQLGMNGYDVGDALWRGRAAQRGGAEGAAIRDREQRDMKVAGLVKFGARQAAFAVAPMAFALIAFAQRAAANGVGRADPGQIGFQVPVTPIAEEIEWFHNDILMPIITAIVLLVLGLIAYVIWRFNEKANPTPSKTTHNTLIEVAWTLLPVLVLVVIAVPSFRLLTNQLTIPPADLTVKVTASQWHWNYTYPKDQGGGFSFDSYLKPDEDIKPAEGDIRLLSVDNEAVVPVNKIVVVQVTAVDVIHSFVVPSFGVRIRGARPPQRDMVQGGARGGLLRPVLEALRQGPRLHADRLSRRQPGKIPGVGGGRQKEVRRGAERDIGRRRAGRCDRSVMGRRATR
jgi:cytochrome c oxidase subunit 2